MSNLVASQIPDTDKVDMTLLPMDSFLKLISARHEFKGGWFTMKSKLTGKDYTFRLRRTMWNGKYLTHCYVETQYMKSKYLGTYRNGQIWRTYEMSEGKPARGIAWIIKHALAGELEKMEAQVEIMHLGRCIRCGKPLTDAESIKSGMGSFCRNLIFKNYSK